MVLADEQWAVLEPLVEQAKPKGKTPLLYLRRTLEAIIWRCSNGANWRAIPAELGPRWAAAQTFIRWNRLGVWQRLLALAQEQAVQLGMRSSTAPASARTPRLQARPKRGDIKRARHA